MFGIGEAEFAIIVIFGFMLFGPDKLPGMGRTIGRALKQFRTAQEDLTKVVQTEMIDPMNLIAKEEEEPSIEDDLDAADSDADLDEDDTDEAPRKAARPMSFAERKAQLEAGRKAAAPHAASEDPDDTDLDEDDDDLSLHIYDADSDDDIDDEEPEPIVVGRSAADLYGVSGLGAKAAPEPESEPESEPEPEPETAPALDEDEAARKAAKKAKKKAKKAKKKAKKAKLAEDAAQAAADGEEDGDAQA